MGPASTPLPAAEHPTRSEHGVRVVVDDCWDHLEESLASITRPCVASMRLPSTSSTATTSSTSVASSATTFIWCSRWSTMSSPAEASSSKPRGIVEYHLGGTRTDYLPQSPFKAVLQFVTTWAKDRGDMDFHIGGGFGTESGSLLRFKLTLMTFGRSTRGGSSSEKSSTARSAQSSIHPPTRTT